MKINEIIIRKVEAEYKKKITNMSKKAKCLSEEALHIAVKSRDVKTKRKRKINPCKCRVTKKSKE